MYLIYKVSEDTNSMITDFIILIFFNVLRYSNEFAASEAVKIMYRNKSAHFQLNNWFSGKVLQHPLDLSIY